MKINLNALLGRFCTVLAAGLAAVLLQIRGSSAETPNELNCFDETCAGRMYLYLGEDDVLLSGITSQLACRVFGLFVQPVTEDFFFTGEYLDQDGSILLFLNGFDAASTLDDGLVPPAELSPNANNFTARIDRIFGTADLNEDITVNFLVFDREVSGCDSPRCILGVIQQYIEQTSGLSLSLASPNDTSLQVCNE